MSATSPAAARGWDSMSSMIRRARYGSAQVSPNVYGYAADTTRLLAVTRKPRGGSRARGRASKGIVPVQSSSPAPETGSKPSARGRIGIVARGRVPDVTLDVRVHEVLRRRSELAHARQKLAPVARGVDGKKGGGRLVAAVQARPAQGDGRTQGLRSGENTGDDRAVDRASHGQRFVRPAPNTDLLDTGLEREPLSPVPVTRGVAGIDFLDEQVLDVGLERRQAPGDPVVASDDHAGHARQRRADGAQARGVEGCQIPDRRRAQPQVRVVGEDGSAGPGSGPGEDPGVAAEVLPRAKTKGVERSEGAIQGRPGARTASRERETAGGAASCHSSSARIAGSEAASGSNSAALSGPTAAAKRARRISSRALPARSHAIILAHPRLSTGCQGSGETRRIRNSIGRAPSAARKALTPAA